MKSREDLLDRLRQVGEAVAACGKARALLGFGSVADTARMDGYSDLDFLVVPKEGCKTELVENLDWLAVAAPIAYCHQNTGDGFKLFFKDDIFCEFGILYEGELENIPHDLGRVIWAEPDFNESVCQPTVRQYHNQMDNRWVAGEILTLLYVGLCRYTRGEKLSAARMIQRDAADLLMSQIDQLYSQGDASRDLFQYERRFEARNPDASDSLKDIFTGYEKTPDSALRILELTKTYFSVNGYLADRITTLVKNEYW